MADDTRGAVNLFAGDTVTTTFNADDSPADRKPVPALIQIAILAAG